MIGAEARISYLKQNDDFKEEETAFEYLKRHSELEDWNIRKVASKFQLDEKRLDQKAISLSGGWRMRLKITDMLLSEPNLFLLDEPTNYLDLNTLILLEEYLRSYKGSFLLISHDREFLKRTCEETIEISKNNCYHYPGSIEKYLVFKEQKLAVSIKANKSLARQQEHLQEFVNRFRSSATKAKQAQSVIGKIKKLENKRINIESKAGITRISIPPTIERHNFALRINNLAIGYDGKAIVSDIDFDCKAGQKVAVLGLNGQGKTTLLKTLTGFLKPISGTFRWSTGIKLAYHGPDPIEALNDKEKIEDYLQRVASPNKKNEAVLKMAGDLLFRNDDLKKTISILSGGEKARLLLAGLLLSEPDIFILDEPTCHLDFETVEALAMALQKFNGTIFFTSHDRTFSSLIATDLLEIKNGKAKHHLKSYERYVEELEEELAQSGETIEKKKEKSGSGKEIYLENKEKQKKVVSLEKQLEKLNKKQLELLEYFLENPVDYDHDKTDELKEVKEKIAEKEENWLEINE